MAAKAKPIHRYSSRLSHDRKRHAIYTIIDNLECPDEDLIVRRIQSSLARIKNPSGVGLEAILRDAVLGPKSKVKITLQGDKIRMTRIYDPHFSDEVRHLPFHLNNVIRRIRQGKIVL